MAEQLNTSNSGSGAPGFKPCPLQCFLRQGTLFHFVSLHPGVLKGTGDILLGGGGVTRPGGSSNTPSPGGLDGVAFSRLE